VIQPNAQVCRRLAGASLECRPPFPFFLSRRSGRVSPGLSVAPIADSAPLRALPPLVPFCVPNSPTGPRPRPRLRPHRGTATSPSMHHYHRQLRHASASASGALHGRPANERVYDRVRVRVSVCMLVYAPLDDATSRPLMAISAAGHQRVPTGPNRPGQLASVTFARARSTRGLLPVSRSFSFS